MLPSEGACTHVGLWRNAVTIGGQDIGGQGICD